MPTGIASERVERRAELLKGPLCKVDLLLNGLKSPLGLVDFLPNVFAQQPPENLCRPIGHAVGHAVRWLRASFLRRWSGRNYRDIRLRGFGALAAASDAPDGIS